MKASLSEPPLVSVSHYSGPSGRRYFAYQSRFGDIAGVLSAKKFAKYIAPSDVVLDFGCGGGFVLKSLTCRERLGVDINPLARRSAETSGITCYQSLGEIENATVDVAIAHHSLEHVPSPLQSLRDLQLKLKPGGLLLLVVPIDDWRTQRRYDPAEMNHHLYTWTPLLLGHLLYEAGFDTQTLSITIGINGWFGAFPYLYGRVPQKCLDLLLHAWCILRKTRELMSVVRKPQPGPMIQENS